VLRLASRLPDFKPSFHPSRNRRAVELYERIILSNMVVSRPGGSLPIESRVWIKPATLQQATNDLNLVHRMKNEIKRLG
jgi:hypothetical protein